jgi:hypothetical protein
MHGSLICSIGCAAATTAAPSPLLPAPSNRAREIRSGRDQVGATEREEMSGTDRLGDLFHGIRVVFCFPCEMKGIEGK